MVCGLGHGRTDERPDEGEAMSKELRLAKANEILDRLKTIEMELMELEEFDDAEENVSNSLSELRGTYETLQGYQG